MDTHGQRRSCVYVLKSAVNVMSRHPHLLILLCGGIYTFLDIFVSSYKGKQIVIPAKNPEKFFSPGSSVVDLYNGQISYVSSFLVKQEVVFLMYYAPWCVETQEIRSEFEKAANFLSSEVRFVAVNCWWPEGECRKNYKFQRFPELYLYYAGIDGFRYTGVKTADYIINFIRRILYPLTFLHDHTQVIEFIQSQDNAVVGYFDFHASPQPPGFLQYYFMSMRLIEHDNLDTVRCGVVTQKSLAEYVHLNQPNTLILFRVGNYSLLYPAKGNFTSSSLWRWVVERKQPATVKWLSPSGRKSIMLSSALATGPSLLALVPVNQLHSNNYYQHVLREISLSYSYNTSFPVLNYLHQSFKNRHKHLRMYRNNTVLCTNFNLHESLHNQGQGSQMEKNCCISLAPSSHGQGFGPSEHPTRVCEYCKHSKGDRNKDHPMDDCNLDLIQGLSFGSPFSFDLESLVSRSAQADCLMSVDYSNINEYRTLLCKRCHANTITKDTCVHRRRTDPFVNKGVHRYQSDVCRRRDLEKQQGLVPPSAFLPVGDLELPEFIGLSGRTNRSLNMYMMDLKHNSLLVKMLFPAFVIRENIPVTLIIDEEDESHYIMNEEFTLNSLAQFIMNFTNSTLKQSRRSQDIAPAHCLGDEVGVCVHDVTADTFHATVNQEDKDVLLLVYAPWCGFCLSFNHVLLKVAKYFHLAKNIVFTRLNGDANDLPWEFSAHQYPIILFFPARRKADSIVFPSSLPKTFPNLVNFILSHSTHDLKVDTFLDVCSNQCIEENKKKSKKVLDSLKMKSRRLLRHLQDLVRLLGAAMGVETSPTGSNTNIGHVMWGKGNGQKCDDAVISNYRARILLLQKMVILTNSQVLKAKQLYKYMVQNKNKSLRKSILAKYLRDVDL